MANILVVEDDENMRILLNARLKNKYNVTLARDGKEALACFENGNVNLIITDIMMPVMDGYTLVELLRSRGEEVPVIMLTAKDEMSDKEGTSAAVCVVVGKQADFLIRLQFWYCLK